MRATVLLSGAVSSFVSIIATVVALNILVPSVVEAQQPGIRAGQFSVVDDSDALRALLASGPGVRSEAALFSTDGRLRLAIQTGGGGEQQGSAPDAAGLFVFSQEHPGNPGAWGESSRPAVVLGTSLTGTALRIRDAEGQFRVQLGVDAEGSPSIQLLDAEGGVVWSAP